MTLPRPRLNSLIFEITQRCNHACLHCYNVWEGKPLYSTTTSPYTRGELDTEQTLALLAKALDDVDCDHITLTGGEPSLRQDLPQIVDFLRERDVRVTIVSNGRLLTAPVVMELLKRGVTLFELPLLSYQRRVHDQLSGVPGAFDGVTSAMANIRVNGGQFVAVFVITRLNLDDLYQTIKLAFAFGARALMLNRFNPGGRGRTHLNELLPSVEQVRKALEVAESASLEFGIPISCSIPIQPCLIDTSAYPHLGFGFCAVGTKRAYYTLDSLGNVRPCNHSTTILGNLFEESFDRLVTPEKLNLFLEAHPALCHACDQRAVCQGGCKAAAQVCYGSLGDVEPFLRCGQYAGSPP